MLAPPGAANTRQFRNVVYTGKMTGPPGSAVAGGEGHPATVWGAPVFQRQDLILHSSSCHCHHPRDPGPQASVCGGVQGCR